MGGVDTKGRYRVHWGAPETYGERREESALRRSGRTVPDAAYEHFGADRPRAGRRDPARRTTTIPSGSSRSSRRPRPPTATCPSRRSSGSAGTGAWYAMIYGTATLLRPPPVRAAGRRRRRRTGRGATTRGRATWPASSGDRPGRRAGRATREPRRNDRPAQDAGELAPHPASGEPTRRTRPTSTRRSRRAPSTASRAAVRPRPGRGRWPTIADLRPARPRRGRLPGRRQVASGRRAPRPTGATSWPTATGPTRPPGPTRSSSSATRTRSSRAWRSPPSRSAPTTPFIAVRATETEAIRRLEAALGAAEEAGFIGPDVLGTRPRPRPSSSRPVQGAYMLGEETVLLKALEGKRGQPEQRPPYPAERGLFGRPTVVHNVQTLAAARGSCATGADGLRGDRRPGLRRARSSSRSAAPDGGGVAEVPLGTPLREIVGLAGATTRTGPVPRRHARRRAVGRDPAGRPARHARTRSSAAGGRRPRRLGFDRRRRRPGLHRGPGPAADPLLRRRGLRQDDPLPDRHAPAVRDRRPDRRRHARGRPTPTCWPTCRPTSSPVGAVRSRAPGDPSAGQRDAILPSRARREAPSVRSTAPPASATRSRWPTAGRRTEAREPMADLIARPASSPEPTLSERLLTTQSPQRPQSTPAIRIEVDGRRRRGPRGPDDPRGLPRQRDRDPDPVLRAQAARLRRLPDVRGRGRGRGAPADQLLADGRAGDEGPDPDRGGPPAAARRTSS